MRDSRKRKKIVKASGQPYITFRDLWYHKCTRKCFYGFNSHRTLRGRVIAPEGLQAVNTL